MTGAPFPVPAPADLAEAFRWSEQRTVSKTALVSLHGNRYQVDPGLTGCKVELIFDPFDLTSLAVRYERPRRGQGAALPDQPPLPPQGPARGTPPSRPPAATGIDYLALVDTAHAPSPGRPGQLRRPQAPARNETPP